MNTLRKPLAILSAAFFVFTAVFALFLFNFDRKAFTAETYQKVFAKEEFYNRLPVVLAQTVMNMNTSQLPISMQGLNQQGWEAFFRSLLPPETLKVMGDDALNSTFAYLNMQADSAQLSLAPLKASMMSDVGVQAVYGLLSTQPDCSLKQIAMMTFNLLNNQQIEFCKPPELLNPLITPAIQAQLQVATLAIPDQIVLARAPADHDPRQSLKIARLFMRLTPILPLAFLLLLTILAVNSLRGWLEWWGISFAVTGFLAMILSLGGAPVFSGIMQRILINRMQNYLPVILLDYAGDLAKAMVQALLKPVLIQGIILLILGLVMAGVGYYLRYRKIGG
jgi:hypothetical protein